SVDASSLYANGRPLADRRACVEDFAFGSLRLSNGAVVRLACSWKASVGREAIIEATVHGTKGGARLCNVDGSFFDFTAHRMNGTSTQLLHRPPDDWFGRAAAHWARRLSASDRYDPAVERAVDVADAIDRLYAVGVQK